MRAATVPASHSPASVQRYARGIFFISLVLVSPLGAQPPDLLKKIAAREAETEAERAHYLYRQTMQVEELETNGKRNGEYREVREVIFSPSGERTEQFTGTPVNRLFRLQLTEDDFRDLREIQPLMLTPELVPRYETKFRGEETVEGRDCWVLEVKPRQIFQGERYFQGMVWALQADSSVVRMEGQAVPPVYKDGKESLFPHFITVRKQVDGRWWFPFSTAADDVMPFRTGPLRLRMKVQYENYKKFSTDSKITFEK